MAQEREIRAIGTPRECNISPPVAREVAVGAGSRWW